MGDNQRVAVKIVDDRGIESLRIMSAGEVITMLTGLNLTNFRIFDDEVTVRFRPITILIGKKQRRKVDNRKIPFNVATVIGFGSLAIPYF